MAKIFVPVDPAKVVLLPGSKKAEARMPWADTPAERANAVQERDENGLPLWKLDVVARTSEGSSVWSIQFGHATEPVFDLDKPVVFIDLMASAGLSKGAAVTYFTAGSLIPQTVKREHSGN